MAHFDISPQARDVVGAGMRAPFQFGVGRGIRSITTANGLDKIQASIRDILMTRPGERMMQPEYGSRLFDLVFEPNDPVTYKLLEIYAVDALKRWERRIRVTGVNFFENEIESQHIGILINFTVLATHENGSYVFPYERRGMPMARSVSGSESNSIFVRGTVGVPEAPNFNNIGSEG